MFAYSFVSEHSKHFSYFEKKIALMTGRSTPSSTDASAKNASISLDVLPEGSRQIYIVTENCQNGQLWKTVPTDSKAI